MSEWIRFHLDEHIPFALAKGLKRRGIDATTAKEAGLLGAADEQHLKFARQSGRVIVTQDEDYLRLHARGVSHAGITYCKKGTRSIGQMLRALITIYDAMTPDEIAGRLLYF